MFREETLTCQVAKSGLTIFLQSANGGTVMPTAARVLPGLNMLHSAHAPASSLQFVDGQELLSALGNSSPLFHLSSCLHGLTSYFTGCPCGFVFGFVWGVFVFVACCCFLCSVATWLVTPMTLDQGDLCRTCTHYYCNGYPLSPKMEDRPYNQYGQCLYTEDRWDQLFAWLTGNPSFRKQLAGYKQALRDQMGYSQEDSDPRPKARRTVPPPGEASSSSAAGSTCHIRPPPPPFFSTSTDAVWAWCPGHR